MHAPSAPLEISNSQLLVLKKLSKSPSAPHREVTYAKALLLASQGLANTAIGAKLSVSPTSVSTWRKRFSEDGLVNFGKVKPGRGRRASIPESKIEEIVKLTQESTPEGETHWSCRTMAQKVGVSKDSVQRIWSSRGIKPHLVKSFKISNDPNFEEKLVDVVGLYLNSPDNAVVLCMDEKSSIQALDRTQPSLPMKKGRAGTMTHDYKRNGTTTLFAALNVLTGMVIGQCLPKHRNQEFLKFLKQIDKEVPKGLQIHLILDNYATHKHQDIKAWLEKHPHFHLHFTPTSSSWLNLVERWFRNITDKAIRRGVFKSVPDLITAIEEYLNANNKNPKPFIWTQSAEAILEKVKRGRVALKATPSY
ncbi:MAG: IS630 family transposase [Actinobacteria bacterium]|jgi:transposase|nr:IS630 family transposase [Actinomycetota bacterium]MCL6104548.1 IS630 family transposase [Actinomycetota bacterium]